MKMLKKLFAKTQSNCTVTVNGNSDGYIDAGNSITIAGNHTGGSVDAGNFIQIGK